MIELLGIEEKTYTLNLGPQHPSTHGVLRVLLEMDGEFITKAEPVIGYGHRGHEHMAENRNYTQFLPNLGRVDYLHALAYNQCYCMAVEKLLDLKVPERAEYIRVITCELNRISSHLLWFGAYLMDLGAFTPFLYCFDDREHILDLLDRPHRVPPDLLLLSGSAACPSTSTTTSSPACRAFVSRLRSRWDDYNNLVTKNVIFINRTRDVGIITRDQCVKYGITGPNLRGSGIPYDIRKSEPYSAYPEFDFEIPIGAKGDILRPLHRAPGGDGAEPAHHRAGLQQAPRRPHHGGKGAQTHQAPGGRGLPGRGNRPGRIRLYIVSQGDVKPYRIKLRIPSFANMSIFPEMAEDTLVADLVANLGSIDVVIPEIDR